MEQIIILITKYSTVSDANVAVGALVTIKDEATSSERV